MQFRFPTPTYIIFPGSLSAEAFTSLRGRIHVSPGVTHTVYARKPGNCSRGKVQKKILKTFKYILTHGCKNPSEHGRPSRSPFGPATLGPFPEGHFAS